MSERVERAAGEPRWTAGDQAAFSVLVRTHGGPVFGFVLRRVRDRDLAEDLAQETFLRAWRARGTFRGSAGDERGWLLAIAANVVRDHVRARARRPLEVVEETMESVAPAVHDDPSLRTEHAEALDRLVAALRTLPGSHREMFLLRERDGLSYKEIARVMDCPIGTVMSGLARARERLLQAVDG